ncbi:hypothetical protein YC2023_116994 [Brassica napus]
MSLRKAKLKTVRAAAMMERGREIIARPECSTQLKRIIHHISQSMALKNQSFVISSELMIVLVVAEVDWDFFALVPPL